MAINHGADALGLVGEMPSGPGIIDDSAAREIAASTPPGVETFLLTSRVTASDITDHVRRCGTTTVQIVRHIDPDEYPALIEQLPATRRVQVIHVEDRSCLQLMEHYQAFVHAFLLDSGRPNAAIAEFGGTGRAHDWEISAEFVAKSAKPVYLAGGLNPGNAHAAISTVNPFGVDLCSGVRTNDKLNPTLLDQFTQAVWDH